LQKALRQERQSHKSGDKTRAKKDNSVSLEIAIRPREIIPESLAALNSKKITT
jgi:hypothetical protein